MFEDFYIILYLFFWFLLRIMSYPLYSTRILGFDSVLISLNKYVQFLRKFCVVHNLISSFDFECFDITFAVLGRLI